jgi:hypothetical protein
MKTAAPGARRLMGFCPATDKIQIATPAPPRKLSFSRTQNSLVGTFDVEMPSGLIVRGAMLLEKNGSRWINFPSKEWIKSDGSKGFFPLLEFKDRATRDRFQAHVLPLAEAELAGPAPEPSKQERQRGHWSGPDDGPNDEIGF